MKTRSTQFFATIVLITGLCTVMVPAHGQPETSADTLDIYGLSFEDLMKVRIVSASKKEESLFESPVTSFVITRNDILNSGATSIPETLRLAPGLIVREMSNGSYDVSIRGGKDNLPSHQWWYLNTSILAMINNRVIFNHYSGGTYWQSLPVDLADVERIEIIYGPNSPLYGPNALDGVISIITRQGAQGDKPYGSATVQAGRDFVFTAMGGKNVSDKMEVNISVNHAIRKRAHVEYYDPSSKSFIGDLKAHADTSIAANPYLYFPNPDNGSKRTGMSLNLYYKPWANTKLSVNSAYNESFALIGGTYGTNLQHFTNRSATQVLKAEIGNFTVQSSLTRGHLGTAGNISEYSHNYSTWDNYADYHVSIGEKVALLPSISYQNAVIDDKPYTADVGREGLFNNKASMYNYAFGLRSEYTPMTRLRIVGAVRIDKFRKPERAYLSFQTVVNYKTHQKGIVRLLAGRSFTGSFIEPSYIDWTPYEDPYFKFKVVGNPDRNLLQNDVLEIGYKIQAGKTLSLDFSVFRQHYSNFVSPVTRVVRETSFSPPQQGEWNVAFRNIDLESKQTGATMAALLVIGKIKLTPSVTVQKTLLSKYSPYYFEAHPAYAPKNNIENTTDKKSEYAPSVFGGFSFNLPARKWNFNVSGYYYSNYQLSGLNSLNQAGEVTTSEIDQIHGKLLLNANIGYNFSPGLKGFLNGRNILAQSKREGYGTDKIGTLVLAGINVEF